VDRQNTNTEEGAIVTQMLLNLVRSHLDEVAIEKCDRVFYLDILLLKIHSCYTLLDAVAFELERS
jgi:hypothetical protein